MIAQPLKNTLKKKRSKDIGHRGNQGWATISGMAPKSDGLQTAS